MKRSFADGIRVGVRRLLVPDAGAARRSRDDLEAELQAHIAARVEYLVARGQSRDAAHAEAMRRFGDVDTTLAILQESADEKDRRLAIDERISSLRQDARFVLRGLRRSPAFAAGVIVTLTLGLGINSAVFRVADRVLLRAPAGVVDAASLRRVITSTPFAGGAPVESGTMSYPDAESILDSRAFRRAAAYAFARTPRLAGGREISGVYVDSGFFAMLGVRATVGRLFDANETQAGSEIPVAVLSYDLWQRELGGAPLTNATSITVSDKRYRVIGVTQRGFTGIDLDPIDLWLPFGVASLGRAVVNGTVIPWYRTNNLRAVRVVGRMMANATDARVATQAVTGIASVDKDHGRLARTLVLRPISSSPDGTAKDSGGRLIGRLAGVAILVLIIACANAANLLLARALRRRREIAVRLALGAARARVVRLLIVESILLGLIGGGAAALGGYWTGEGLRRLVFPDAKWATTAFDDRAIVFTLVIALVAGLIAGLAPALQLTNPDLVSALKDNRHQPGRRSHRTRAILVVVQTAFSVMLLIASGLLVRSLQKLNAISLGFDPDGLVTALVPTNTLMGRVLDPTAAPIPGRITAREVADRMRRHPAVRGLAMASTVPFGAQSSMDVSVPGRPRPEIEGRGNGPFYIAVSPEYFSVMGTRLLRGRSFANSDDRGSQPVAVVGQTMAKVFWPNGDPFNSCILLSGTCAQVVGIVEDVRDSRGAGTPPIRFYLPLSQHADSAAGVIVRTSADRAPTIASLLKAAIPSAQRPQVEVISDRVALALRPWRLATMLFTALGLVALVLACVGVYSVMSYVASERVHELGVRVVLGATSGDIVRLVLTGGLRLVGAGTLLGLAGAAAGAHLLESLLFAVSAHDPAVYAGAVGILCGMGIAATLVPALRVMNADPTVALRAE